MESHGRHIVVVGEGVDGKFYKASKEIQLALAGSEHDFKSKTRILAKIKNNYLMSRFVLGTDISKNISSLNGNAIVSIIAKVGDRIVFDVSIASENLSKDLVFKFKNVPSDGIKKGDRLRIIWKDSLGVERSDTHGIRF